MQFLMKRHTCYLTQKLSSRSSSRVPSSLASLESMTAGYTTSQALLTRTPWSSAKSTGKFGLTVARTRTSTPESPSWATIMDRRPAMEMATRWNIIKNAGGPVLPSVIRPRAKARVGAWSRTESALNIESAAHIRQWSHLTLVKTVDHIGLFSCLGIRIGVNKDWLKSRSRKATWASRV